MKKGTITENRLNGTVVKQTERTSEIHIDKFLVGKINVKIIGNSPLIYNSMSFKSKGTILFPPPKKTAADKAQTMKHNPIEEFRNSMYKRVGNGPTRLTFPAAAFKSAICNAALEIPGTKKSQIGRLVWVVGDSVDVYGVPKLLMSVVRSADMNRTPDVRTRAILTEWCCSVNVQYVVPTLNETAMARLFETAGIIMGIGDFRQEKGKGNYGQFRVDYDNDQKDIIASGGIKEQDKAIANPDFYDAETQELFSWFEQEKKKRGR